MGPLLALALYLGTYVAEAVLFLTGAKGWAP